MRAQCKQCGGRGFWLSQGGLVEGEVDLGEEV